MGGKDIVMPRRGDSWCEPEGGFFHPLAFFGAGGDGGGVPSPGRMNGIPEENEKIEEGSNEKRNNRSVTRHRPETKIAKVTTEIRVPCSVSPTGCLTEQVKDIADGGGNSEGAWVERRNHQHELTMPAAPHASPPPPPPPPPPTPATLFTSPAISRRSPGVPSSSLSSTSSRAQNAPPTRALVNGNSTKRQGRSLLYHKRGKLVLGPTLAKNVTDCGSTEQKNKKKIQSFFRHQPGAKSKVTPKLTGQKPMTRSPAGKWENATIVADSSRLEEMVGSKSMDDTAEQEKKEEEKRGEKKKEKKEEIKEHGDLTTDEWSDPTGTEPTKKRKAHDLIGGEEIQKKSMRFAEEQDCGKEEGIPGVSGKERKPDEKNERPKVKDRLRVETEERHYTGEIRPSSTDHSKPMLIIRDQEEIQRREHKHGRCMKIAGDGLRRTRIKGVEELQIIRGKNRRPQERKEDDVMRDKGREGRVRLEASLRTHTAREEGRGSSNNSPKKDEEERGDKENNDEEKEKKKDIEKKKKKIARIFNVVEPLKTKRKNEHKEATKTTTTTMTTTKKKKKKKKEEKKELNRSTSTILCEVFI